MPSTDTLLCLPSLSKARSKLGINLIGAGQFQDFEILSADANMLSRDSPFLDDSFDLVLCNSVLEHDRYFWKTLAQIKRITRPGGVIGIGVPGYLPLLLESKATKIAKMLSRIGFSASILDPLRASTLTLRTHNYPGDYYRFSPQAVSEVFLEGLVETEIQTLMIPPRVIGFGVKPAR